MERVTDQLNICEMRIYADNHNATQDANKPHLDPAPSHIISFSSHAHPPATNSRLGLHLGPLGLLGRDRPPAAGALDGDDVPLRVATTSSLLVGGILICGYCR